MSTSTAEFAVNAVKAYCEAFPDDPDVVAFRAALDSLTPPAAGAQENQP